jgi:hypothetical protein
LLLLSSLLLPISCGWETAFSIERFVIPGVKGGTANAISAIASHYPWFYTFRILSHSQFLQNLIGNNYLRNALIGFTSSVVSDTFANSIRVVKTAKQSIASKQAVTYREVIAMILAVDGFKVSIVIAIILFQELCV